jgi:hypothetical protein
MIDYVLSDNKDPNEFEFAFGGDLTTAYLNDFLVDQFNTTFGVKIATFTPRVLMTGLNPVSIEYTVDVVFAQSSAFIPSTQDVDALIELAFQQPSVQTLLDTFHMQPPDLPFMTTTSVTYTALPDVVVDDFIKSYERDQDDDGNLSATQKGLISGSAAIAVLAFLLAFLAFLRRCRKRSFLQVTKHSKSQGMPLMPSYSYCDSRSSNLMPFKDDTRSTSSSDASHRTKARSTSSSMSSHSSSHSSSVTIRAI